MSKLKQLKISSSLALPIDAVTGTIVVYGRKRKGKTYKAKVLAEEMLKLRQQIVVIDPTDAWWGLQSSADGAAAGFPITIFGGRHANLPLEATAGEELADAIAEDDFSAIFSLKGMSRANEQRFCYSFLERLYRRNPQKALHIFMDEADIYAPQNPFGEEARTLGATQNMVRRGGIDGLGMTLITQRPAVLSKSVSSQCDTLISVGLNDPLDLDAVERWVKANFEDRDIAKRLLVDIPTLGRPANKGIAWVLSADREISERVMFRELVTFDSGRTPKVGEKRRVPRVLSKVDLEHLGKRIAATVEKAKETDPKHLRTRIAELEKQVAAKQPKAPAPKVVEKAVVKDSQITMVERVVVANNKLLEVFDKRISSLRDLCVLLENGGLAMRDGSAKLCAAMQPAVESPLARFDRNNPGPKMHRRMGSTGVEVVEVKPASTRDASAAARDTSSRSSATGDLPSGEAEILRVILGRPDGVTRREIAVVTGYKKTSRVTYLQKLAKKGLVEKDGDRLVGTAAGRAALPEAEPLPTGSRLRSYWLDKLPDGEARILSELIAAWPNWVAGTDLDTSTGYKKTSRVTYVQKLKARQLAESNGTGIRASELLFAEG